MPCPPPISCQSARSSADPCARRGYHASGIHSARPSDSSTTSVSAVTVTPFASGVPTSVGEEVIPFLSQKRCALHHDPRYSPEFDVSKTGTLLELDRIEPELRCALVALHMHVGRFVPVVRVEEHPVRTFPEDGWQCSKCSWEWGGTPRPTVRVAEAEPAVEHLARCYNTAATIDRSISCTLLNTAVRSTA